MYEGWNRDVVENGMELGSNRKNGGEGIEEEGKIKEGVVVK